MATKNQIKWFNQINKNTCKCGNLTPKPQRKCVWCRADEIKLENRHREMRKYGVEI